MVLRESYIFRKFSVFEKHPHLMKSYLAMIHGNKKSWNSFLAEKLGCQCPTSGPIEEANFKTSGSAQRAWVTLGKLTSQLQSQFFPWWNRGTEPDGLWGPFQLIQFVIFVAGWASVCSTAESLRNQGGWAWEFTDGQPASASPSKHPWWVFTCHLCHVDVISLWQGRLYFMKQLSPPAAPVLSKAFTMRLTDPWSGTT